MKKVIHALSCLSIILGTFIGVFAEAAKSDLRSILPLISDVKDQKGRNTCTVQTTIALIETYLLKSTGQEYDLSEEWLQYLAALSNESGGAKGSVVMTNIRNALRWGLPSESTLPYTRGEWKGSEAEAIKLCSHLKDKAPKINYVRCLYGKFPESYLSTSDQALMSLPSGATFAEARSEAAQYRGSFANLRPRVISRAGVKALIDAQKTVALEINLFHGAWNTAAATSKGMGRDTNMYKRGIVTYPEVGTMDRQISPTMGNRHAVQIVGYDEDLEISYKMKMTDGTVKSFKRKGVYIFKNSWGTKDFGSKFAYDKMKIRGFGMILMDHANEFGKFTAFE